MNYRIYYLESLEGPLHDAEEPRSSLGGDATTAAVGPAHLLADQAQQVHALVVHPAEGLGVFVVGLDQGAGLDADVEGHPQVLATLFVVVGGSRESPLLSGWPDVNTHKNSLPFLALQPGAIQDRKGSNFAA